MVKTRSNFPPRTICSLSFGASTINEAHTFSVSCSRYKHFLIFLQMGQIANTRAVDGKFVRLASRSHDMHYSPFTNKRLFGIQQAQA